MKNLQRLVSLILLICMTMSLMVVCAEDISNDISLQAVTDDVLAGTLTFDGCVTLEDLKALPEIEISGMVQDISVGAVSDDDPFKPSVKMGLAEQVGLDFKIPGDARTEGAYKVTYWLYNATGVQVVIDAPMQPRSWSNGAFSLLYVAGNKATVDNMIKGSLQTGPTLATLQENKWYKFEHIIDLNDRLVTGFAYDADGNKIGESEPYEMKQWHSDQTYVVDHFQSFRIRGWKNAHTFLDNFKIEEYHAVPEISRKKVSFEMLDGSVVKETKKIEPGVNKIVLNFGTTVNETTAAAAISFTKDGVPVAYNGARDKNTYVMDLTDILEPNSTYTLNISTGVTNMKGVGLKEAVSFDFETTEGGFRTERLSIKNAGEEVENFDSIPGSDALTVDVKYQNLLPDTVNLTCVIGYYDINGRMLNKIIRKIPAYPKTADTVSIPCSTVPVNCNSLKAFLWDGLETMLAYQEASVFEEQSIIGDKTGKGYTNVYYDYNQEKVIIHGKADTNNESDTVNIQVLKSGETFENFEEKTDAQKENALLYMGQQNVASTDGKFAFVIGYDESDMPLGTTEALDHCARIVADNGNVIEDFDVSLATKEIYQSSIIALNQDANDTNKTDEQFADTVKSQIRKMNLELGGLENDEIVAKTIISYREYIKTNPMSPEDTMKNRGIFLDFMLMEAAKAGNIQNVNDLVNDIFFSQDNLKTSYQALAKSDLITAYFTAKFKETINNYRTTANVFTLDDFNKAWEIATILTTARYGTGWGELKNVLTEYGSSMNITTVAKDSVYQSMMGKDYTKVSFKNEYDKAVSNSIIIPDGGPYSPGPSGDRTPAIGNATMDSIVSETQNHIKMNFTDIDGVSWASEAILALADKGVINGKEEGIFKPNDLITREEFVKILVGAMNLSSKNYKNHFNDIKEDDWFCKWVNIAYENGICNGITDTLFGVGQQLTRQDMVVLINNAMKVKGVSLPNITSSSFDDENMISDYATQAVNNMVSMGAIKGVSEKIFDPLGQATRAQAATVIYRVLEQLQ